MAATLSTLFDSTALRDEIVVSHRSIDRFAMAHDASHYLLVPEAVVTPETAQDVADVFQAARSAGRSITFRSGGTSLSGQGVSDSILVDTRRAFQKIEVLDAGARVRVQPGATVRQTNTRLMRHGRKLGPDPASEIACTIGGVVANNSSGMACGIEQNSYRTLESMVFVLPSGTIIDTSNADADARLRQLEPELYRGLVRLRERVGANPTSVGEITRQYSMKNTMGYGLNSFLDFETPIDVLTRLIIGSEGTLAFVAEATFATVEVMPHASTGLMVFPSLRDATASLPALVDCGLATIELMDAESLRVAQRQEDCPREIADLDVAGHAAYLIEFQARSLDGVAELEAQASSVFASLPLSVTPAMTADAAERASLWHTRKGLYTTVAGARPSGTTALLEDIVVPVDRLFDTCESLTEMFAEHGYDGSVIFGHAKDGNIHFMLNEQFDDSSKLDRYTRFTEQMVDLVLDQGGNLKAEHGTGRIMAPFVHRQYGDELYGVMLEVKALCDPAGILNPGVLLSDNPTSYLENLKVVPKVEHEVDRCVECGYCEPTCPSKNVTLTPRQRIVIRREIQTAEKAGDSALVKELEDDYEYEGIDTCAVDGLCRVACPVDINTGDLVRRLRAESRGRVEQRVWKTAATHWGVLSTGGGKALSVAKLMPTPLPVIATKLGRALLGDDVVPLYDGGLPGGGTRRPASIATVNSTEVVYFAACINTMFGPAAGSQGVGRAFLDLCDRAGVEVGIPTTIGGMCCGTPWKSKGYGDGFAEMTKIVLQSLLEASRFGELPIVCDAASCTEGLETMQELAARSGREYASLRFVDAVEFVDTRVLPRLVVTRPVGSVAIHHTCSTTTLGENDALTRIVGAISDDVFVPVDWGCCAFAGDRGMLHPELTASATSAEAAEVGLREFDQYVSANRTCEIGMTRATGREYRHVLEVLEEATR